MAFPASYEVTINPGVTTVPATSKDGGSVDIVILDDTNVAALRTFIAEIKAGTDVSSVVTAINSL